METNVKGASITLDKTKQSIKELEGLSQAASGTGKKELLKVIKQKQQRVETLEKHIKEGNAAIAEKKKELGSKESKPSE